MVSQQEYDPWGKVRTGGIGQTTLNYTGQRLDGTGLLYYHARYYDPGLARFVSADPTVPDPGLSIGLNRYAHAYNNPLRHVDATGYGPEDYYVFANGCTGSSNSGGGECANSNWGEYLLLLRELFDEGNWGQGDEIWQRYTFEQWAFQLDGGHARFVGASTMDQGANAIENELSRIQGTGSTHLIGHSMGGGAIAEYLRRAKVAQEYPVLGDLAGYKSLDPRVSSVTLLDPYVGGMDPDLLGAWANDQGVNFKVFDAQGDGVNGCFASSLFCEPNPDYSVDLNGNKRSTPPPSGDGLPRHSSSQALHTYTFTFTHVARQTQDWLRVVWK